MDQDLRLKIIRTNRRTLALEIAPDGTVLVRGPRYLPEAALRAFARSKRDWIEKQLHQRAAHPAYVLEEGALLPLYGEQIRVHLDPDVTRTNFRDGTLVLPGGDGEKALAGAENFYRRQARKVFEERLAHYAPILGVVYASLAVTGAKTRWGSCSQKGEIRLNWRLLLGKREWLDYVVVHELAHRKQMNHSPAFWALVESVLPDYRVRKKELNQHQGELWLCIACGS